jgi:hypothetical protein
LLELRRICDANRFGGLEADPRLDLGRLFHGQIGRIGFIQNPLDVIAALIAHVRRDAP